MVNQPLAALARQEAKSPVMWIAMAAAAIAWPISVSYSPLATTLGSTNARDLAYEVAYLLALCGALYSDKKLAAAEWLFGRASAARRGWICFCLVGLGSMAPPLLSLAPLAFLQGAGSLPAMAGMGLISFHIAAIVLFLRALGFSHSERSVALVILALALPASVSTAAGPLNFLWRALDPAAGGGVGAANLLLTFHQLGSIIGLGLLAHTLALRVQRQR